MGKEEKIIYIDMDEVIVDCMGPLLNIYNKLYQSDITIEDITQWDLPPDMQRLFRLPEFFVDLPPTHNRIQSIMLDWLNSGWSVRIVSDSMGYDTIRMDKESWISCHLVPEYKFILEDDRSSLYVPDEGIAILVDDNPKHLDSFLGYTICFDRPWNTGCDCYATVYDQNWEELVYEVNNLYELHKKYVI